MRFLLNGGATQAQSGPYHIPIRITFYSKRKHEYCANGTGHWWKQEWFIM